MLIALHNNSEPVIKHYGMDLGIAIGKQGGLTPCRD
jgi:hypothetical protein